MVKVAKAFRLADVVVCEDKNLKIDLVICEDKNLKIVLDEQANGSRHGSNTLAL